MGGENSHMGELPWGQRSLGSFERTGTGENHHLGEVGFGTTIFGTKVTAGATTPAPSILVLRSSRGSLDWSDSRSQPVEGWSGDIYR